MGEEKKKSERESETVSTCVKTKIVLDTLLPSLHFLDLLHLQLLHLLGIVHGGVLLELGPEHVSEGDALGTLRE